MNNNINYDYSDRDEARRLRRQKRRRQVLMLRAIFLIVILAIIGLCIAIGIQIVTVRQKQNAANNSNQVIKETIVQTEAPAAPLETEPMELPETEQPTEASAAETPLTSNQASVLDQAKIMAMGYDYNGAISLLKTIPTYESDSKVMAAINEYETLKASCVPVDVNTVPHIFYHSLINDTNRAFNYDVLGQSTVDGMNAWMTTVEEFDRITQALYDNGYVYVRLRDLVTESVDEYGNVSFAPNTELMLPPEKKAIVLSIDDLSYYHSYQTAGYPDKLVLDDEGKVKCHYYTADGSEEIGDYDVVPRLNTFLETHPDGSYHGARGIIALTGYNGVFGYRTDADYELQQNLVSDQAQWLSEHPDFNRQDEIAKASVIADAIKASGWEFASHTWGHLSVTNKTADELAVDNEKWVNNVQNIVGPVDTIIFAHGNDIGDWQDYTSDNEKFQYFKSAGYNFFCNVDGSVPYWVQIRSNYVRQGRINLDGYMLYQSSIGATTVIDHLFKASEVFDSRRPTPVIANGES